MKTPTEIELCLEYQEWCRLQRLPAISADDLLAEPYITVEQSRYLTTFIARWNMMVVLV
jgi:hypothetical protein